MNDDVVSRLVGVPGRRRKAVLSARVCAIAAGVAGVALLGLSGWFIAAAAGAGAAGVAASRAFNYMLPAATIRLLAIVRTATRYGERVLAHEAALHAIATLRPRLFDGLCAAAPAVALKVTAGEGTAAVVGDVKLVEEGLVLGPAVVGAMVSVVVGIGLVAVANRASALGVLAWIVVLAIGTRLVSHRADARAVDLRAATVALKDELAFLSAAEAELRCYALESWTEDRLTASGEALERARIEMARVTSRLDLLSMTATGLAAATSIVFARADGAPLAALAALAAAMTLDAAGPVVRHLLHARTRRKAAERLGAWLPEPVAPASTTDRDAARSGQRLTLAAAGSIEFLPGSRIGLVGPSGCGKTTLVETLIGLRPAQPRSASIDGCDLVAWRPATLRRCFSWLPQDATLIAGSIRENLALAGEFADDGPIWQALHDVALVDLVRGMPAGLDTWIGADGIRLSGGERRRLALARTYLRDAPWLLLDEPTEGLDRATEAIVVERLQVRLRRSGQGLILVSHRPQATAICDVLVDCRASPIETRRLRVA